MRYRYCEDHNGTFRYAPVPPEIASSPGFRSQKSSYRLPSPNSLTARGLTPSQKPWHKKFLEQPHDTRTSKRV